MEEAINQGGELLIGAAAALCVICAVVLLLSPTDAGILRAYWIQLLEAAS